MHSWVVLLVCSFAAAVVALPSGPGYGGVVLSAPQYGERAELDRAYVVPTGYAYQPEIKIVERPPEAIEYYNHVQKEHQKKYEEKVLKDAYNKYLDKKVAYKKGKVAAIFGKAVEKAIDLKAVLTQQTLEFITKVAIKTAANLAKSGVKAKVHKIQEKQTPEYAYKYY
ncbi:uncharacterized protein LOC115878374 [Sitophilus oryzae]|uniref:Uncharacterized protein LOC115878374 n=1 Tax=Sitophilus oryzae TaxID=7048 RepID=A0A6J2XHY0_SITOR|nr:uncharacterized protein LOC115878374 [Sitophilus oryzae]